MANETIIISGNKINTISQNFDTLYNCCFTSSHFIPPTTHFILCVGKNGYKKEKFKRFNKKIYMWKNLILMIKISHKYVKHIMLLICFKLKMS